MQMRSLLNTPNTLIRSHALRMATASRHPLVFCASIHVEYISHSPGVQAKPSKRPVNPGQSDSQPTLTHCWPRRLNKQCSRGSHPTSQSCSPYAASSSSDTAPGNASICLDLLLLESWATPRPSGLADGGLGGCIPPCSHGRFGPGLPVRYCTPTRLDGADWGRGRRGDFNAAEGSNPKRLLHGRGHQGIKFISREYFKSNSTTVNKRSHKKINALVTCKKKPLTHLFFPLELIPYRCSLHTVFLSPSSPSATRQRRGAIVFTAHGL